MPQPTEEQLREYDKKLPSIYKDILLAFPEVSPLRRTGDSLTFETICEFLERNGRIYREEDVDTALSRLESKDFFTRKNGFIVTPSPLGERLIEVSTGRAPFVLDVPELPVPAWG